MMTSFVVLSDIYLTRLEIFSGHCVKNAACVVYKIITLIKNHM